MRMHILRLLSLGIVVASAQLTQLTISPQDTDPAISTATDPYYVFLGSQRPAGGVVTAFIHLPGTYGVPANSLEILRTAAEGGLLALGLSYPNPISMVELCAREQTSAHVGTASCEYKARYEILTGQDTSPLISVTPANSIFNRVDKALAYLARTRPAQEGWAQLLLNATTARWDRITISGHSQGGGHAMLISQLRATASALAFGAPGDGGNWMAIPGTQTPPHWKVALSADTDFGCARYLPNWAAGFLPGPFTFISPSASTLPSDSHQVCSTAYDDCINAHSAIMLDSLLQRDSAGGPVIKGIWKLMMSVGNTSFMSSEVSHERSRVLGMQPMEGGQPCQCRPCASLPISVAVAVLYLLLLSALGLFLWRQTCCASSCREKCVRASALLLYLGVAAVMLVLYLFQRVKIPGYYSTVSVVAFFVCTFLLWRDPTGRKALASRLYTCAVCKCSVCCRSRNDQRGVQFKPERGSLLVAST